jgi:hypothetical protein
MMISDYFLLTILFFSIIFAVKNLYKSDKL